MLKINEIYNGNCVDIMQQIDDDSIDLTITSPPYDNLRDYEGYVFEFEKIAHQLFRVTKKGGVVVWVVGDATINGSETGTSFRQALYFMECGFKLHDTMIYAKSGCPFPESNRYNQKFEYMFVFSKAKPKTVNLLKQRTKYTQQQLNQKLKSTTRSRSGEMEKMKYAGKKEFTTKPNIWKYSRGFAATTQDKFCYVHPAMFPEKLALDHIISWSNKNDLILDPMCGSGTVPKMAKIMKRNYIGIDISEKYCNIAKQRLANTPEPLIVEGE
jgi:site-specific DNA-methyltransferase (adenine-specific)